MKSLFKNRTVRQISLFITGIVWTVHVISIVLFLLINHTRFDFSLISILIYLVATFGITFYLSRYLFESFVFRKIKLIYKVISNSKDSLSSVSDERSTTLDEVNESVINWAADRQKEISSLKELENYRKNFVGDISHELKTPIFAIQGFLHTLLDGALYDENINHKYLARAAKNADRLQLIVDDLEMINNLESEATILNIDKFSIKSLAQEVIEDLELLASEKGINFEYKPGADRDFLVTADREKIRQVFVNLISNAIKYGNENGHIKISFYDMDELVLIEVSDNGIGIDPAHHKHLFDRFYRAEKSRARNIGGSGLGLSIVKHILEAHDQKITVRSTIGKGSTFGFTLRKK